MEVERVGRHPGSETYIQGSTHDHENEGKTNNIGWMMYSVYALLGVCSARCILYSVYAVLGKCCTHCQLSIMQWRDSERWLNFVFCDAGRVVDKKERNGGWRWERCGGYEGIREIRGTTYVIGLEWPCIGGNSRLVGTRTCRIRAGKYTRTQNSLKSQFLTMISLISSHHSLCRPQLYRHLKTRS